MKQQLLIKKINIMKIFINITSWIGISPNAIHYYAKIIKNDNSENIYDLIRNCELGDDDGELSKKIDKKEADFLNKKDGKGSLWREGMTTRRFNSVEEIKEVALKEFPNEDIAFLRELELISEDLDVIVRTKEDLEYTGQTIKIIDFRGFSGNFNNIINGSTHKVIKTPSRYKNKELQKGYWVKGVYEPALVLIDECELFTI